MGRFDDRRRKSAERWACTNAVALSDLKLSIDSESPPFSFNIFCTFCSDALPFTRGVKPAYAGTVPHTFGCPFAAVRLKAVSASGGIPRAKRAMPDDAIALAKHGSQMSRILR